MVMGIYSANRYRALRDEPIVLAAVFLFLVITIVFLINLLVAQLSCAYAAIYADMVGYARMKRNKIIVESMTGVSPKRWDAFKKSLALHRRIEFNEGDVGVVGGIQTMETAGANPTTVDTIKRFGGSTSPLIQWPEEDNADDDSDRFARLEVLIKKTMERLIERAGQGRKKGVGASSSGLSGSGGGSLGDGGVGDTSGGGAETGLEGVGVTGEEDEE
jgi:uncharacterized membrane protein YgcG